VIDARNVDISFSTNLYTSDNLHVGRVLLVSATIKSIYIGWRQITGAASDTAKVAASTVRQRKRMQSMSAVKVSRNQAFKAKM